MDHAWAAARSQPVLDSIDTAKLLSEFQTFGKYSPIEVWYRFY